MAFTGNKFEFRAVGSNQSCAGTNVALNTIMAWALDEICSELEAAQAKGEDFNAALQKVLKAIVKKHKRVLFDGDGYSDAWKREAAKRGLLNLTYTPAALKELVKPNVVKLFETYKVLSTRELHSRYEIYAETYVKTIAMEAECALRMARTMIAPAAMEYASLLADGAKGPAVAKLSRRVQTGTNTLLAACDMLEAVVKGHDSAKQIAAMGAVRAAADELESLVPESLWPIPGYGEMFFLL
jgi:glutamine synthetase